LKFFVVTFKILILIAVCIGVGILTSEILGIGEINLAALTLEMVITDIVTLAVAGILLVIMLISALDYYVSPDTLKKTKPLIVMWLSGSGGKDKDGDQKEFYDVHWLSEEELNRAHTFSFYKDLKKQKDGVVVRAEYKKGNLHINLAKPIHTLVIGTTGSGKTEGFINPTIQSLSETSTKPCMLITDPKGELYYKHSRKLKECGYNVQVLDLREPFSSSRWNPLHRPYSFYRRSKQLENEIKIHTGANPIDLKLKVVSKKYEYEWYEFDGVAYPSVDTLKEALEAKRQELQNEAFDDINDVAAVLCPIENKNDPTWDMGARDFIKGIVIALMEDTDYEEFNMNEDKFNFYNVNRIANTKDPDPDNSLETLQKYFAGRSKFSKTVPLVNQVVNNAHKTAQNFVGQATGKLSIFADNGLCYATSGNEINFEDFIKGPTALFIKIADEKETRHPIASMCILQLYKSLVSFANLPQFNGALKRPVYFVLDEFGNLPKIEKLESIITVGRSRKIFLLMVIQSYQQLNLKYGDNAAEIIKNNCNIQIFFGSTDDKTKKEFSERCGHYTISSKNSSKNVQDGKVSSGESSQEKSRPLIYPDELSELPEGIGIVSIFKSSPVKSRFTFSYKVPLYSMKPPKEEFVVPHYLNEEKIYYDINYRNSLVFKPAQKKNKFDFDF